jgi:gas vesicle protein
MAEQGSSAGSVIVAFALGAVAGAVVALLYAPAAGEETRRRWSEKAREARDRAKDVMNDAREMVDRHRDDIADVVQSAREAVDRGRDAFNEARRERL